MRRNKQQPTTQENTTILFGYGLFILIVVSIIISTVIPWTTLLFQPHVLHLNVSIMLIALVAGGILPVLISYIIGDSATHTKNKASHHYNGVLFGLAAYWVSMLFSIVGSETIAIVRDKVPSYTLSTIVNGWPIIATLVVMSFVAISYAKHQKNKSSILQHVPYQIALIGSITLFFGYLTISQSLVGPGQILQSLIYPAVLIILIFISYLALKRSHPTKRTRLLTAIVAATIAMVALSTASQILAYIDTTGAMLIPMIIASLFGLLTWIAYLYLISRKSS